MCVPWPISFKGSPPRGVATPDGFAGTPSGAPPNLKVHTKGHVRLDGMRYYVADKIILKTPLREKLVRMVYATADKLRRMERAHESGRNTRLKGGNNEL
jgi:hypothetical protein